MFKGILHGIERNGFPRLIWSAQLYTFFVEWKAKCLPPALLVIPGYRAPVRSLSLGVLGRHPGALPPAGGHQLRQFYPRGRQALGHAHPARVAGESFAQARGLCRGVDPPSDLAGRQPEHRRCRILHGRILRHDRLQGLGGRLADVQDHALRLRIRGPADVQQGSAVLLELHVAPPEF